MELQLIKGHFGAHDALDLITQMIDVKIKFQEGKIHDESTEEDVKMRERRIKQLQKELFEARQYIDQKQGKVSLNSIVTITD